MYINNVQFNSDLIQILNELKTELNVNGIFLLDKIKDSGEDVMVTCPYHADGHERRPSAGIRKSDGLFHCLACGETHSLYEVISHCFGHTDDILGKFGWNWLLKNFATVIREERKPIELQFRRGKYSSLCDTTNNVLDLPKVSEEELSKYRFTHPYWKERGITNENIIELFDLGYDKETNCITFPIRDKEGNCLFVARRSVNTKYFNYPSGAEKPLYGLYEIYQLEEFPKEIIVCESMLDALAFWEVSKYAVALNGTGTYLQEEQLKKLPCRKLIVATDMDTAGTKARHKLKMHIRNKIITEYQFPNGIKDANQCLCSCGKEILKNLKEIF